jgi:hypothetical protein
MRVISLQSGSNGNCIYVTAETYRAASHRSILGDRLPLHVATRYEASGVMEV